MHLPIPILANDAPPGGQEDISGVSSPVSAVGEWVLLGDGRASTADAVFPIILSIHCIVNCIHTAVTTAVIISHGSACRLGLAFALQKAVFGFSGT